MDFTGIFYNIHNMATMIQERIDKVLPYLRGFAFDQDSLYKRFTVLFPATWDITYLKNKSILLGIISNYGTSLQYMIGVNNQRDTQGNFILQDQTFDYFIDEIERVILINNEKERKQELLKEKIAQLQEVFNSSSLEEVEKLQITADGEALPMPIIPAQPTLIPVEPVLQIPPVQQPVQQYVDVMPMQQMPNPRQNSMVDLRVIRDRDEPVESDFIVGDDFNPYSRREIDTGVSIDLDSLPQDDFIPPVVRDMARHNL